MEVCTHGKVLLYTCTSGNIMVYPRQQIAGRRNANAEVAEASAARLWFIRGKDMA
jgi:hypothetical protein